MKLLLLGVVVVILAVFALVIFWNSDR